MTKPKIRFCTYFNKNYLLKGLALADSLHHHSPSSQLEILCMDNYTKNQLSLLNLPGVTTHRLSDFEDSKLLRVKGNRSLVEYYWTCTPSLPLYLFSLYPDTEIIIYLDADLYFFSSVDAVIRDMDNASIYLVEHRYPPDKQNLHEISGRFNVAVNGFRRDIEGLACLEHWRDQCIEWCYLRYEKNRMGDQLYLNAWPTLYQNIIISQHKGIDAAPWNISNYRVSSRRNIVCLDYDPLITYHFHQLEYYSPGQYQMAAGYQFSTSTIKLIYQPYLRKLDQLYKQLKTFDPTFFLPRPPVSFSAKINKLVDKFKKR